MSMLAATGAVQQGNVALLVERVRESAAACARAGLEALAASVAEITDNRAQTFADSVMYRQALASAAAARGWVVHWYDADRVRREAAEAIGRDDIDAMLKAMGRALGPPWQAAHRLAAAAALSVVAVSRRGSL